MTSTTDLEPRTRRVPAEPPEEAPRRSRMRGSEKWAALILLLPALVGFAVFYVFPTIRGAYYSTTDFNLLTEPNFVGAANFAELVADPQVWDSLRITAVFAILNIVIVMFLALILAAFMQRLRLRTWVRSLLLLPWLVPNVAIALIWAWLFDANVGFLTNLLGSIGIEGFTFYNADAALWIIILISVWSGLGYTALLLYAGMLQVPTELYEAGALDGASEVRMFFRITLPLIRPVLALVLVVSLIGSFQVFDLVQVGYGNNPIPEVRVIYYYIYQQAFSFYQMGYASAIAILLVVILGALTFVQMRLMRANRSDLA
ncbi:carbohydrate ABC transporter permease [Microbacterium sp. SA39]|uniref:carbohydrate ABC transporter permease n=1 Tax=Microbacterium sp. SA39 TaxID=1263625 RepID=UPI00061E436A|nr:sugar ABC transporter permease [Microbacterium sp. SA39]KJQ54429.1 sn-glycerol-3-phosphate transport system permease protein UgpA [Microbacterium sp. SA39]